MLPLANASIRTHLYTDSRGDGVSEITNLIGEEPLKPITPAAESATWLIYPAIWHRLGVSGAFNGLQLKINKKIPVAIMLE